MLLRPNVERPPAPSAPQWQWPNGDAPWQRVHVVLLVLSVAQILSSIYLWVEWAHPLFIFCVIYTAHAVLSFFAMVFRVRWGLIFLSIGLVVWMAWLCYSMYDGIRARLWIAVCFSFAFVV